MNTASSTEEMCVVLIYPTRHRDPSAALLDHSDARNCGEPAGGKITLY